MEEPLDQEAYDLCEALYDQARECGAEIEDDAAKECAEPPKWDPPCRDLRKAQFECYTALSCSDEEEGTPAFQACETKLGEASDCTGHR